MFSKGQKTAGLAAATVVAALYSVPSLSAVQTWTYDQATQSFNNTSNGNTLTQFADGASSGVKLVTSGFSDTADVAGTGAGGISNDTIESAKLIWGNTNPNIMGLQDQDETGTGSPHHSIDSFKYNTSDTDPDGEFDMLLLTFDTAVSLDGINLDWAQDGSTVNNKADVSILAWNGQGAGVKDVLVGKTWSNVLASNGGGYTSVGNYADVGLSYYAINSAVQSTKWLIGVYNPAFGSGTNLDGGNDGLKLASLTTSTTPPDRDVPVPGTISLILAGLAALRARGARKVKA